MASDGGYSYPQSSQRPEPPMNAYQYPETAQYPYSQHSKPQPRPGSSSQSTYGSSGSHQPSRQWDGHAWPHPEASSSRVDGSTRQDALVLGRNSEASRTDERLSHSQSADNRAQRHSAARPYPQHVPRQHVAPPHPPNSRTSPAESRYSNTTYSREDTHGTGRRADERHIAPAIESHRENDLVRAHPRQAYDGSAARVLDTDARRSIPSPTPVQSQQSLVRHHESARGYSQSRPIIQSRTPSDESSQASAPTHVVELARPAQESRYSNEQSRPLSGYSAAPRMASRRSLEQPAPPQPQQTQFLRQFSVPNPTQPPPRPPLGPQSRPQEPARPPSNHSHHRHPAPPTPELQPPRPSGAPPRPPPAAPSSSQLSLLSWQPPRQTSKLPSFGLSLPQGGQGQQRPSHRTSSPSQHGTASQLASPQQQGFNSYPPLQYREPQQIRPSQPEEQRRPPPPSSTLLSRGTPQQREPAAAAAAPPQQYRQSEPLIQRARDPIPEHQQQYRQPERPPPASSHYRETALQSALPPPRVQQPQSFHRSTNSQFLSSHGPSLPPSSSSASSPVFARPHYPPHTQFQIQASEPASSTNGSRPTTTVQTSPVQGNRRTPGEQRARPQSSSGLGQTRPLSSSGGDQSMPPPPAKKARMSGEGLGSFGGGFENGLLVQQGQRRGEREPSGPGGHGQSSTLHGQTSGGMSSGSHGQSSGAHGPSPTSQYGQGASSRYGQGPPAQQEQHPTSHHAASSPQDARRSNSSNGQESSSHGHHDSRQGQSTSSHQGQRQPQPTPSPLVGLNRLSLPSHRSSDSRPSNPNPNPNSLPYPPPVTSVSYDYVEPPPQPSSSPYGPPRPPSSSSIPPPVFALSSHHSSASSTPALGSSSLYGAPTPTIPYGQNHSQQPNGNPYGPPPAYGTSFVGYAPPPSSSQSVEAGHSSSQAPLAPASPVPAPDKGKGKEKADNGKSGKVRKPPKEPKPRTPKDPSAKPRVRKKKGDPQPEVMPVSEQPQAQEPRYSAPIPQQQQQQQLTPPLPVAPPPPPLPAPMQRVENPQQLLELSYQRKLRMEVDGEEQQQSQGMTIAPDALRNNPNTIPSMGMSPDAFRANGHGGGGAGLGVNHYPRLLVEGHGALSVEPRLVQQQRPAYAATENIQTHTHVFDSRVSLPPPTMDTGMVMNDGGASGSTQSQTIGLNGSSQSQQQSPQVMPLLDLDFEKLRQTYQVIVEASDGLKKSGPFDGFAGPGAPSLVQNLERMTYSANIGVKLLDAAVSQSNAIAKSQQKSRDAEKQKKETSTSSQDGPIAGPSIKRPAKKDPTHVTGQTCLGCSATSTPEWRRGPMGPRTLCNACGLIWSKMLKKRQRESGDDTSSKKQSKALQSGPTDQAFGDDTRGDDDSSEGSDGEGYSTKLG